MRHQKDSSFANHGSGSKLNYPMPNKEIIEQNGDLFEIYIEDDSADIDKELPETNASPVSGDSSDRERDVAFGMLITRELQKMLPEAKRKFKRNVTQLLYS